MANYQDVRVKLTNTQLTKLKSAAENKTGTILRNTPHLTKLKSAAKNKTVTILTLFRMGIFRAAHGWGGQKGTPS